MRTIHIRHTATAAAVVLATTGVTLADTPRAVADETIRLSTVVVPDRQHFLDLGEPDVSPGDMEISLDDVQRRGRTIGVAAGQCTLIEFTPDRLVASCTATLLLSEGSLVLQGANDEDPNVGPTGFEWAVTGGTGRYTGARGEAAGTFQSDPVDRVDWVIRLE
jgi:hypothetical protein